MITMNPICTLFPIFNFIILLVCGSGEESDPVERERCSRVHLDAITSDNAGNNYAFRGAIWVQPLPPLNHALIWEPGDE